MRDLESDIFFDGVLLAKCPNFDHFQQRCLAATSHSVFSTFHHNRYCQTKEYDDCAIFLGKVLRSVKTCSVGRDKFIEGQK